MAAANTEKPMISSVTAWTAGSAMADSLPQFGRLPADPDYYT